MTLTLAACVSLPPPSAVPLDIVLPAVWSRYPSASTPGPVSSATASPLGLWWQHFNDPLLDQLIAQALQANSTIKIAKAALLQSRALRDVSAAGLMPGINASASTQRSKAGDASPGNTFNAGFDASWEPDIFGGKRSALQVGEANAQASAASLADVQVSIAAEVAVSYIQLRGAQARLTIARNNLASQSETLQITNWRVQAGLLTSLEGEQARAANEQTRAQLPILESAVAQLRHSLAVLCAEAPEQASSLLQVQLALPAPVPQAGDDLVLSIPAETLRQRPDVRAAEYQVNAALARVSQADAARYPQLQISGSLGLRALTLGALSNSAALISAILAKVAVPVFDAGAGRAQVRAQQAAFEQARLSYQSTVLIALKEVEDALVALAGDRERLLRLRNAADAAANAALMARQRYASGLVDFQTVLETQRSLLSTQDAVASTTTDLSADHVRLYKALGGGWQADADPSTNATQSQNL